MTIKIYKEYRPYQGFENLDKSKDPFEQMLEGVYFDMISRNDDKEVKRLKDINKLKLLRLLPVLGGRLKVQELVLFILNLLTTLQVKEIVKGSGIIKILLKK